MVDFIEKEVAMYNSDEAKAMRSEIRSIESFIDYLQYEIHCLSKQRAEKIKDYQKILGLEVPDESVKAKA